MGLIFSLSAQSGEQSGNLSGGLTEWLLRRLYPGFPELSVAERGQVLETCGAVIRKCAHFTAYGVLAALVYGALRGYRLSQARRVSLSAAVCFLYACTDEWHQRFIDGRGAAFTDVLIDTAGAAAGLLLACGIGIWIQKRRRRRGR